MDTKQTTQSPSLIATLAERRDAIYALEETENRNLTREEEVRIDHLNLEIAKSRAVAESDVAILAEVARGSLECWEDGVGTPEGLAMAHAALRSAHAFLSAQR